MTIGEIRVIKNFTELEEAVLRLKPIRIVVVSAEEKQVLGGVQLAAQKGIISEPILVGNASQIKRILREIGEEPKHYRVEDVTSDEEAAQKAITIIRNREAQVLVKGRIRTEQFLRAVLDKENGIKKSSLLSNLTLFELSTYHKFIGISDIAIIPCPGLKEKVEIIKNSYPLWLALGITNPKVAVLAAVEIVNPAMQATVDAACLAKMSQRNQLGSFIVDGPLSYDIAMNREFAEGKGISGSQVAGNPDLLLVPDLEAGNILGKSLKINGKAQSAAIVFGADVPIMINSRSDSAERRYYSTLLARAMLEYKALC